MSFFVDVARFIVARYGGGLLCVCQLWALSVFFFVSVQLCVVIFTFVKQRKFLQWYVSLQTALLLHFLDVLFPRTCFNELLFDLTINAWMFAFRLSS